jgi:phage gp16-like protein
VSDDTSRRRRLGIVHIAKVQLGLDDDAYRALLQRVTGKRSARSLSEGELGRVIDEMRSKGFTPKRSTARSDKRHVRLIFALWNELRAAGKLREPERSALRSFVRRMTGVEDPEWLSPKQANVVIEALKAWLRRKETNHAS